MFTWIAGPSRTRNFLAALSRFALLERNFSAALSRLALLERNFSAALSRLALLERNFSAALSRLALLERNFSAALSRLALLERNFSAALSRFALLGRNFSAALSRFALLERKSSRRGSVAIQIGILMTVLIGMGALGTEIPYLMYMHRQMQTVADSAALGGAVALSQGYPAIATEADGIAAALGFTNGTSNVTVTVNNPPKSGNYTANSSAVEVIVSQPITLKMAGLFGVSAYNLSARAVALSGSGSNTYCMLSLDNSSAIGIGLWGGVQLWLNGCGLAANSSGSGALTLQSGGTLAAGVSSLVGQMNNVWSTVWAPVKQNQPAVADPYANVAMPASTGCDYNNFSIGYTANQTTLSPGRYCNGLWIGNGANILLSPGIYYIKSGTLTMTASPCGYPGFWRDLCPDGHRWRQQLRKCVDIRRR